MTDTENTNHIAKQRVIVGAACVCLALLLFGVVWKTKPSGGQTTSDPGPTTTVPTGAAPECATVVHYFAYDTDGNRFGPASAFETVQTQRDELHRRRCQDPALLVSHLEYWNGTFTTSEERAAKVQSYVNDRKAWSDAVALLELGESTCSASITTMNDSYNTLYMVKSTDVNVAPAIFQTSPDRPSFSVLRFDCPNANAAGTKQFNYKLDCGFQPVDQNFPGVPGPPAPPSNAAPPCTNCAPPPTVPPCRNCTPTTVPPSTTPPTTGGCPPGYNCKDPTKGINNDPATCNLGDCGPRPVEPTPPPPDSTQPQATVKPPASVPPPPVTIVTQPTVTVTVVTPSTAPG